MSPGKAIIGAALLVLCAVAVLAASAGATKPCPVAYCTDSNGEYVLEVPPLPADSPIYGAFADCVWDAHVEFGDGTGQDYVFDAAVGLTGSHVFPTPGVTYTVDVVLSNGHHGQTADPCPNYGQSVEVRYRTAAEEADEPPEEPQPNPEEPIDEGGAEPDPPFPGVPDVLTPKVLSQEGPAATVPASAGATSYWLRCGGGLLTHMVDCRKGRAVARTASARLARPGTARAEGFACRLPRGVAQQVSCRRGDRRILAPAPRRALRLSRIRRR